MKEVLNSNKVFSDDNNDTKSTNFQIEHMKNKIKNVKKKKRMLNIKNIEPLVNIHETSNNHSSTSGVKEGFTFKDCDWTGEDNIYEGSNTDGNDKSRSFAKIIEEAFNTLETWYDEKIHFLTKVGSSDTKHINHDKGYLKRYFNWIVSILVASIAVYNWCFILFYKDGSGARVDIFNVPREQIKKATISNPFMQIVNFFTDIPLFTTDAFKHYVIDYFPEYIMNKINDPTSPKNLKAVVLLLFMIILALSVFMVYGSKETIKSIMIDFAKLKFSGVLPIIVYTIVGILFLMTFIETNPLVDILPIGSFITLGKFANPMFWLIKIVLLIYLIFIGAPLSTAIFGSYLLLHSLFGMFYNGFNIWKTKNEFDDFLKQFKPIPKNDTACHPLSFFDKIVNYMTHIFNYIYDNCIQIGIIIVMLYALLDSQTKIKNNNLKIIIMVTTLSFIGIIGIINMMRSIFSTSNNETLSTNISMSNENITINPLNIPNTEPTIIPTKESMPDLANKIPTKETIADIAGKLNINDNAAIQDGLKQMGNIASSLNMLK